MNSFNILDSIDENLYKNGLSTVSERYYDHKYCMKLDGISDIHHRVSFHTNRICMISLAEYHPIMKLNKKIRSINFLVNNRTNRLKNMVSGKSKRGAQKLLPDSLLCSIECEDGTKYPVYSCIKGKLMEINNTLLDNPNLLVKQPVSEGYIALLLPILSIFDETKKLMLSKSEYNKNVETNHVI